MIEINNKEMKVFYGYNTEGKKLYYIQPKNYLEFLELISNDGCIENYEPCGILDTYGNKFCLSDNDYPINEIKIDSSSTSTTQEYTNNGYHFYNFNNDENHRLYYKKGSINSGIIAYWEYENSRPKFINENNFYFDIDSFKAIVGSPKYVGSGYNYNDSNIGFKIGKDIIEDKFDWAGDLIKNAKKFEKINKLKDYIIEKINDEKNIDYNFTKISNNQYVKNYLGFKSKKEIDNYERIDFSIYNRIFLSEMAAIFSIISISLLLFIYVIKLFIIIKEIKKDPIKCNCDKKCKIKWKIIIKLYPFLIYWSSDLGFLIYSINVYLNAFNNISIEIAKDIKADKYIEDFLKEFAEQFEKKAFIICSITFLSLSALLYILFIIIELLIKCKNKNKDNNSNNNSDNSDNNEQIRRIRRIQLLNNVLNFNQRRINNRNIDNMYISSHNPYIRQNIETNRMINEIITQVRVNQQVDNDNINSANNLNTQDRMISEGNKNEVNDVGIKNEKNETDNNNQKLNINENNAVNNNEINSSPKNK